MRHEIKEVLREAVEWPTEQALELVSEKIGEIFDRDSEKARLLALNSRLEEFHDSRIRVARPSSATET